MMKVNKTFIISVLATMFVFPSLLFAQMAKDAIRELKRLEAKIEVGTSLHDYSIALADAKLEVNMFLESAQANKNIKFTNALKQTMNDYEDIKIIIKGINEGPYRHLDYVFSVIGNEKEQWDECAYFRNLLSKYPEAEKMSEDGGAIVYEGANIGKPNPKNGRVLRLDKLLPFAINKASHDLRKAMALMPKK